MPLTQGVNLFFAALPIAVVGLFSARYQGNVAVSAMQILAKRPEENIKGIILSAMVETYAILAFVISFVLLSRA